MEDNKLTPLDEDTSELIKSSLEIYDVNQCVKKLIDNSLTSNASIISIQITTNPSLTITIKDNGVGISSDHLKNIVKTNKDIAYISKLANLKIISRLEPFYSTYMIDIKLRSLPPYQISVIGSSLVQGTIITVTDLFINIPARKSILEHEIIKNLNQIQETIKSYTLSFYEKKFSLLVDSKEIFSFDKVTSIKERFGMVLDINNEDIIVAEHKRYRREIEFVLSTQFYRTKKYRFIYVNKKFIKSSHFYKIIDKKLSFLLDLKRDKNLAYVVSISSKDAKLDLKDDQNEYHFSEEKEKFKLEQLLYNVLEKISQNKHLVQTTGGILPKPKIPREIKVKMERPDFGKKPASSSISKDMLRLIRVVGQVDKKYILGYIANTGEDIRKFVLIDQHAAHERIRVEWFEKKIMSENVMSSMLSPAIVLKRITKEGGEDVKYFISYIGSFGFLLKIQNGSLILDALPRFIVDALNFNTQQEETSSRNQIKSFLLNCMEEYVINYIQKSKNIKVLSSIYDFFSNLACKGAAKFGDILTLEQCKTIINQLKLVKFPFICAHGRNSIYVIDYEG